MSLLGSARYGVDQAPEALFVVQELLNTRSTGNRSNPDVLRDGRLAGEWLQEVRRIAGDDGTPLRFGPVTEAELRKLRALRDSIAASVTGSQVPEIRVDVGLSMDASGVVDAIRPDRPLAWLSSAVMVQTLLAQRSGDWRRLKICANPDCDLAFFDRSKNRSGVWHDVRVCGNAINLRASRSRRRAGAALSSS